MSKDKKKWLVNAITSSRILGALVLPIIFNIMSIPLLIAVLSLLFVTDFVDGKLARKWNVQTLGGGLLDSLGDKVLAVSCILSLIGVQNFLLIPLFLELGITGINVRRTLQGEIVKSSILGKIKTWFLSVTLALMAINVLNPNLLNEIVSSVLHMNLNSLLVSDELVNKAVCVTAVMQTATAIDYASKSLKNNEKTARIEELKRLKESLVRLFDETKYEEDKDKPLIKVLKK